MIDIDNNSRILDFNKSPKITNLRESEHAGISRSSPPPPHSIPVVVPHQSLHFLKTHHYIIFFVPPRHSKPGMDSYC